MDTQVYIQSGIIESYVLGLATVEEAAELERLALAYPEIKQALEAFEALVEQNALDNATVPDPSLKERLNALLSEEFTESIPVVAPVVQMHALPAPRKALWTYVAAAAIVLLVASAALNVYLYQTYQNTHNQYQALLQERTTLQANIEVFKTKYNDLSQSMQLMNDPSMSVIKMPGVPGKENNLATVYWNSATKDVYLLPNHLPQAPAGKQYQLWAIVDGKPVDAGVLGECAGLCKMTNIPKAQAFAITLEKQGGSPTPTLTALFVMGKV